MLLSKKTRQTYLQALGFYSGKIDGKIGAKTKAAYKALQERYFIRSTDIDGLYGKNTDILLRNAYSVHTCCTNFKLEELRCKCGGKYCTGYPAALDVQFLKNLQSVRDKFGITTISSCLRCKDYNSKLVGSAKNSRHLKGKAADIKNATCSTEAGRKKIMSFWKTLPQQRYTYCNIGGNYPNMGKAVHIDVR